MRKWLRHQMWNICWEIGDTFLGWSMNFGESIPSDPEEIKARGWTVIDVHANCIPKPTVRTVNVTYVPGKGLVPMPATAANMTSTAVVDWDFEAKHWGDETRGMSA
jgi:hypothetical protein